MNKKQMKSMITQARDVYKEKLNDTMVELSAMEKFKWTIINGWDAIDQAVKFRESRESKWKRFTKKFLKISEAILMIAAYFAARKLPIAKLIN